MTKREKALCEVIAYAAPEPRGGDLPQRIAVDPDAVTWVLSDASGDHRVCMQGGFTFWVRNSDHGTWEFLLSLTAFAAAQHAAQNFPPRA